MTKDLMYADEIQELVVAAYRELDSPSSAGARFYTEGQLTGLPEDAREWSLGVGNPPAWADLRPGETVADLGCGGGIDALLAAGEVGPDGHVIGIDLTHEMIERAERTARQARIDNASFVRAEMESIPLRDASVDVVLSNGAVNLSARKSRVFAEAHRVLRGGGRAYMADLTLRDEELPAEILTHPSAWAG